ncbi:hypothetical protein DENSPDRAFT_811680 [Dentipellis sp. KUC8613]|nr:hypothetical protein DENSPDRAFT_811680 [Dentipellis sp. KUC8613]
MLKALRDMSCLLSHPGEPKCRRVSGLDDSLLIAYSTIVDSFVADDGTVIPALRKLRYEVFESAIKHCSLECRSPQLDKLSDLLRQGISEQNRSVRLSAGRGLVELIRLYHAIGKPSWTKVERIFDTFYGLLDTSKEPVKESVLLTVTAVGKATDTQILSVAISCLISQIGHPNPVLKGTAYMQLLSLAKHHKKSPYGLALPYMDKIAPFLIQRWHSQPAMLMEACRFFKMSTSDFISYHLPRTLPGLFASCDLKVLEKIAKDLETQPSLLFLRHSEDVLAHVYLLSTPAKTTQALTFIVNVVADATGGGTVDITNLLRSCIVPLLAKLVNVLGEEDENRVQAATQALHKVEASLSTRSGGRRKQPPPDLATFLKTHMLGVISHLIDMLQDIQGKKTTESKRQILRSLGALTQILGPSISSVAPQIMATLQMMLGVPELSDVTLEIWYTFLTTLSVQELGPQVGPTSASLVGSWSSLSTTGREITRKIFLYFLVEVGGALSNHLDDIVDPAGIPELADAHKKLWNLRNGWKEADKLRRILDRAANDNVNVSLQAFRELKIMMAQHRDFFQGLASGDNFHPTVSRLLEVILTAACRDLDGSEDLRLLAYECLGALGAVDPDRCDYDLHDTRMVVLKNFTDEGESVMFALHLITEVLVGAFRSTSDITYQTNLAYAIQELLRFCQFTPALVSHNSNSSIPLRVRNRWSHLPKHVLETVTPLLEARFSARDRPAPVLELPIYPKQSTYREWIQLWTTHLISRVQGETARTIFLVFRSAVRNKDVGVAHHLLPHLVLTTLVSGQEEDAMNVRAELLAVLQDQVDPDSQSTPDKKLLSAQAVFMLLDHLNKWVRLVRQEMNGKKAETKRSRSHAGFSDIEEQLMRVDSVLSNIDQDLMAKAAFKCKAYARALMSFERHIGTLQDRNAGNAEIQQCYERLHEIYANLDEPDGMEGVSTLILAPTLEHQIRQHESTGRWTSAQSCWELRLQQSPDNLDYHIGLLRCLRNLGHYDTLRTHVKGVLTRNPAWKTALAGFQVESAWMIGDWGEVESLVTDTESQTSSMVVARLLLALRADDSTNLEQALSQARLVLGNPISTAGPREYRHSYEAVLNLHQVHEVEMVYEFMRNLPTSGTNSARQRSESLAHLSHDLTARLELTLPTFRVREPILSMRRTAFGLNAKRYHPLAGEIGRSWLTSARIARKAGHSQTAYSAMLQAEQSRTPFSFIQSARLIKANGEPLRALQALKNSIELCGLGSDTPGDVIDLTEDDEETKQMKAKAEVLHARWMNDSERFDSAVVLKAFQRATELWPKWETATYYLGKFQDECYKNLPAKDQKHRGMRMNVSTVRCFAKSMRNGSKYIYQTVPRMLTIWLDMGEDRTNSKAEMFNKVNAEVARTIQIVPPYMWYMTFPQIVSRIGHSNPVVYEIMADLISAVLREYPQQGLWLFASVMKSTKPLRETRAREILTKLRNNPMNSNTLVPRLIDEIMAMANALLGLCDFPVKDNSKKTLSMKKDFPEFAKLVPSKLIIPLQESLIVTLPPTSASTEPEHQHQPFPIDTPTFHRFLDEIDVMHSLARPRKITIVGNNNQTYMFLGKPKDDLRKDARLMDFYAIINKLLKANSDSRRRQLHIRTYGVVTLNEECGFIQWVPNTIPIRPVLLKYYEARGIRSWYSELNAIFSRIKEATDKDGCRIFVSEVLPLFPPVFHEWFIETFPEPTAWLASRLTYGRTAAVMSMVGFILGLGDRHGENILLDENSGDAIHVDFNCLFEKGKTLETPERVPFRLTQNMVDGLGVTGVEGVFRNACELTLQMLRDNKDILMSVLDAFIHDPLVEWEDEKRKLEREAMRRATNSVKQSVDLRMLAKNALQPIEKKLKGIYSTNKERSEKEFSTTNLVQALIQEATDNQNLGKMYPGWAAFH